MVFVTLNDLLRLGKGNVAYHKIIRLFNKILKTLSELHSTSKSHGSLETDSILVSKSGDIQFIESPKPASRNYFSPEALFQTDESVKSFKSEGNDLWAFGLLFLESIVGYQFASAHSDQDRISLCKSISPLTKQDFPFLSQKKFEYISTLPRSEVRRQQIFVLPSQKRDSVRSEQPQKASTLPLIDEAKRLLAEQFPKDSEKKKQGVTLSDLEMVVDYIFERCLVLNCFSRAHSATEMLPDRFWKIISATKPKIQKQSTTSNTEKRQSPRHVATSQIPPLAQTGTVELFWDEGKGSVSPRKAEGVNRGRCNSIGMPPPDTHDDNDEMDENVFPSPQSAQRYSPQMHPGRPSGNALATPMETTARDAHTTQPESTRRERRRDLDKPTSQPLPVQPTPSNTTKTPSSTETPQPLNEDEKEELKQTPTTIRSDEEVVLKEISPSKVKTFSFNGVNNKVTEKDETGSQHTYRDDSNVFNDQTNSNPQPFAPVTRTRRPARDPNERPRGLPSPLPSVEPQRKMGRPVSPMTTDRVAVVQQTQNDTTAPQNQSDYF
ncbi:hypothetical protein BLNAU_15650 [Blattamonas nauphoetae]|uniref:Protein kinase domain-containing protein n=1 Tax=Blattamonas nauphoetae TaxID=2049346 RepID=A0ABQ9XDI2_9EUKA|nr:hypothetical protein BLNAU_15650 [Blattamonas nauphoetae]